MRLLQKVVRGELKSVEDDDDEVFHQQVKGQAQIQERGCLYLLPPNPTPCYLFHFLV